LTLHPYDHRVPATMVQALEGYVEELLKRVEKLATAGKK
jgi:hypothetical protein